jgi:hypothetical protein
METKPQVGRNEPCPCGSGKKHKNCCALLRTDVAAEVKRTPGVFIGAAIVGLALAGVVVFRVFAPDGETPTAATQNGMPATPPVVINPTPPAVPSAQPPGPPPAGKVWSPEHGHWHDAPTTSAVSVGTPVALGHQGPPSPVATPESQPFSPGTPQPPGPAPAGKVWSPEHGHWHDAPVASATTNITPVTLDGSGSPIQIPAPDAHPTSPGTPQPPGPPPEGKVWSTEHGHWHDAPPVVDAVPK